MALELEQQDQVENPENEQNQVVNPENEAGKEEEAGTATAEEKDTGLVDKDEKDDGLSIEDIISGDKPDRKTIIQKAKENTPPWFQKRIDEISREKNDLKRKVSELEEKLSIPKEKPLPPDRDNFESAEDWQKAMLDWNEKTFQYYKAVDSVKTQKSSAEERKQVNLNRYIQQVEELQKKFPDAYETIEGTNFGNAKDAIADSEHSARIALYLAKNPVVLSKISSITDVAVINREIGKLEAKFETTRTKTTSAPQPLNTLSGDNKAIKRDLGEIKNDDEWYRAWKEQKKKELGG